MLIFWTAPLRNAIVALFKSNVKTKRRNVLSKQLSKCVYLFIKPISAVISMQAFICFRCPHCHRLTKIFADRNEKRNPVGNTIQSETRIHVSPLRNGALLHRLDTFPTMFIRLSFHGCFFCINFLLTVAWTGCFFTHLSSSYIFKKLGSGLHDN